MESKFVVAVILLGAFVSVNSLQCYQCVGCSDYALTNDQLRTCGPGPWPTKSEYVCAKITVKVLGFDHIARGCAESKIGGKDLCDYIKEGQSPDIRCCKCNQDQCTCN